MWILWLLHALHQPRKRTHDDHYVLCLAGCMWVSPGAGWWCDTTCIHPGTRQSYYLLFLKIAGRHTKAPAIQPSACRLLLRQRMQQLQQQHTAYSTTYHCSDLTTVVDTFTLRHTWLSVAITQPQQLKLHSKLLTFFHPYHLKVAPSTGHILCNPHTGLG